jgi:hypothetical protein
MPGCCDRVGVGSFDPEKQIPNECARYRLDIKKAWRESQIKYISCGKYVCSGGGKPGN